MLFYVHKTHTGIKLKLRYHSISMLKEIKTSRKGKPEYVQSSFRENQLIYQTQIWVSSDAIQRSEPCAYTSYSISFRNAFLSHLSSIKIVLEFQPMVLLSTAQGNKNTKLTFEETTSNPLVVSDRPRGNRQVWVQPNIETNLVIKTLHIKISTFIFGIQLPYSAWKSRTVS